MADSKHILIVEDEASIADNISFALQLEGFSSEHCTLAGDALLRLKEASFALAIVDVGLPDMNGFELCKAIRRDSNIPLIFLTARADEIDRILGLELGADDYVTKPFSPRELTTRVKTVLRRARPESAEVSVSAELPFVLDTLQASIQFRGCVLNLTRIEFLMLQTLVEHPGQVFSRGQLMHAAWEHPQVSLERSVDTHIKSLRAKLKQVEPGDDSIQTHRGLGYSLVISD
ncbi:two-component system response regulator CreB [Aliamphritea ceti]|uniref:two-component system response regulator CreB n=1 Tax=Aliamphritea ceti TaxID=1524258 RepID=UPI0021C407E2|nr:two-component system response regulator CreB [Aliamphritea ceti]